MITKAAYFDTLDQNKVVCRLCPLECHLSEGQAGICRSRFNKNGELVTNNYGELVTMAVDPIEKKPLYHFYPGSRILSTGPNCCNLGCRNCQNWTISQQLTRTQHLSADELVAAALRSESLGVAFTYTEPMVWYEYIMAAAPKLRKAGLKVVMVTNGFVNPDPLRDLLSVCDAMNVDLKSINPSFYRRICKGKLEPVMDTIRMVAESDCHLEVTNLIIPGENDSEEELSQLIDFVASVSPLTPLHLSAYHPSYEMTRPATPRATLDTARDMALKKLSFVYIGNMRVPGAANTVCPGCKRTLVERNGFGISVIGLKKGQCEACGCKVGVVQ